MNTLKIFGLLAGAGAIAFAFLKNKKAALQNIEVKKIDVAIDLNETQKTGYLKLFYNLKILLYNSANVNVNIKGIEAKFFLNGIEFAELNSKLSTTIKPLKTNTLFLKSSILSVNIISSIIDIISEGKAKIKVEGTLITDLGVIEFKEEKIV